MFRDSAATVICWAMGITQHRNAVATDQGDRQRRAAAGQHRQARRRPVPGARPLQRAGRPHHGHLGAAAGPLPRRARRRSSASTRRASTATTRSTSIQAMRDGDAQVFVAMGGNFVAAAPDTEVTEEAMRRAADRARLHQAQPLARRARPGGADPPALGRTEKDLHRRAEQRVTVEDSMSAVHASHGPLTPASARTCAPRWTSSARSPRPPSAAGTAPVGEFRADYTEIRERIARVVPGCAAYDEKVDRPGGFVLPHPPRDSREFPTEAGRRSSRSARSRSCTCPRAGCCCRRCGRHDQFNTTIYGLDDRYRGIEGGRRVVFVHPDDIAELGLRPTDQMVDLVSEWSDGSERRRRRSGSWPTTSRAAAPRPTTRRPTRWSRSTRPPMGATTRRPSPSSSGWSPVRDAGSSGAPQGAGGSADAKTRVEPHQLS